MKGHIEFVKQLIDAGATVDKATTDDGLTPLYIASCKGHVDVVKRLIDAGATVDKATTDCGTTPLYIVPPAVGATVGAATSSESKNGPLETRLRVSTEMASCQ